MSTPVGWGGAAISVIDNVHISQLSGAVPFALSSGGTLVYLPRGSTSPTMSMLSASRSGQTEILFDRRLIGTFRIAPDGQRVAVSISDGQEDIWLLDLKQRALTRFTFGRGTEAFPVWSADGKRLFYTSDSAGTPELVTKAIGGSQETKVGGGSVIFPTAISPDGDVLVGRAITVASFDVMTLQWTGSEPPSPLLATAANEEEATFSPDGRYVAFQSDETGLSEMFVQAYPLAAGGRSQRLAARTHDGLQEAESWSIGTVQSSSQSR